MKGTDDSVKALCNESLVLRQDEKGDGKSIEYDPGDKARFVCLGISRDSSTTTLTQSVIWVVRKIMGPVWLWTLLRQLIFTGPKMGPYFWELP